MSTAAETGPGYFPAASGVLLEPLGSIVCPVIPVVASSYAGHEFSWKATLVNAAVPVVMSLVVFSRALKWEFPLRPVFIGG